MSNKSGVEGKRTKIVATIGPASKDEATIRQMIRSGMNVARINFSHGDHDTHGANIDLIRQIAKEGLLKIGFTVRNVKPIFYNT